MQRKREVRCSHLRPITLAERRCNTHVGSVRIDNRNAQILRKATAAFDENHSAGCETGRHDSAELRKLVRTMAEFHFMRKLASSRFGQMKCRHCSSNVPKTTLTGDWISC